jgi:uncharacterized protein YtpQ (UPF0354 family)
MPDAPVLTDLGNGLRVGYVVDLGTRFQYIQRRHLWAAGMTQAELHRDAVARLAMMLNDRTALVHGWEDGFVVLFDGNFDASLILVDALWDRALADFAPNGFVAALPNKNALAFCDSRTPTGPQQLRRFIEDAGIGDHPITTTLYYRDPTRRDWRPYRDPARFN